MPVLVNTLEQFQQTETPIEDDPIENDPTQDDPTQDDPTQNDTVLLGDADGNGKINLADVQQVLRMYLKMIPYDEAQLAVCDVDGNGKIQLKDAQMILKEFLKITKNYKSYQ